MNEVDRNMDVLEKVEVNREELYEFLNKPAANQSIPEQLSDLLECSRSLEEQLNGFQHENHRRPSAEHKKVRADLKAMNKEINKMHKAMKKCNALREASMHIGKTHGKVMLNKTRYQW